MELCLRAGERGVLAYTGFILLANVFSDPWRRMSVQATCTGANQCVQLALKAVEFRAFEEECAAADPFAPVIVWYHSSEGQVEAHLKPVSLGVCVC